MKAGQEPGYPPLKAADRFNSILFASHGDGIRLKGNKLRVPHVGTIRVCPHREAEGTIKTLSLKREADKWFVVITCDLPDLASNSGLSVSELRSIGDPHQNRKIGSRRRTE